MNKLPAITFSFWVIKICATTLGETSGDLISMTLRVGYGISSAILLCFFLGSLITQLSAKKYRPAIYWTVILSTSMAGTTISDYIDRTLGLGYGLGTGLLVTLLILSLSIWQAIEKSISVSNIKSLRGEILYWMTILISNTLGTALGDFLSDSSGMGFSGGTFLIGGLLLLLIMFYYFTKLSHVILFWAAFVLTRPFGAVFGDLLTKSNEKGGLNFGTVGSSLILFILLAFLIILVNRKKEPAIV